MRGLGELSICSVRRVSSRTEAQGPAGAFFSFFDVEGHDLSVCSRKLEIGAAEEGAQWKPGVRGTGVLEQGPAPDQLILLQYEKTWL